MRQLLANAFRVKRFTAAQLEQSALRRCLGFLDVLSIGLAVLLGGGIYTVTGWLRKTETIRSGVTIEHVVGPAIVVSYVIAACCAGMSALCYAEFSSRVPRAGSAYVYSYVTIGEVMAFGIGWGVTIEFVIAMASLAKTWSAFVDSLLNSTISNHTVATFGQWRDPSVPSVFNATADPVAALLLLLLSVLVAAGIHLSTRVLKFVCLVNFCVLVFFAVYGLSVADFEYWTPLRQDSVGFTPYGWSSIVTAASIVFYAFAGFESMCTVAEETKDASRTVPRAVVCAMGVATVMYLATSAALSLMVPFQQLNGPTAFSDAFAHHSAHWYRVVVSVGALCAITASLIVCTQSAARQLYAMADDGLLWTRLRAVNSCTQTPVRCVCVCCVCAVLLAEACTVHSLVQLLAVDTLVAYTAVVGCVLKLRYTADATPAYVAAKPDDETAPLLDTPVSADSFKFVPPADLPTETGRLTANQLIAAIVCLAVATGLTARLTIHHQYYIVGGAAAGCAIVAAVALTAMLSTKKQYRHPDKFQVKYVPWLPVLSMFINTTLICFLPLVTWAGYLISMVIGGAIYAFYGYHHSEARSTFD